MTDRGATSKIKKNAESKAKSVTIRGNTKQSIGISARSKRKIKPKKSKSVLKYRFPEGEKVEGVNTYKITCIARKSGRQLSSDLYIAVDEDQDEEYRIKSNLLDYQVLKKEAAILKKVTKATGVGFPKMVEYGTIPKRCLEFLILSPYGPSLDEIMKKHTDGGSLSIGCGLNVALQMLLSIRYLHSTGFIHRDIRPASFNCGVGETETCVILTEFRSFRRFLDGHKKHVTARSKVKRYGTIRFASRSMLAEKDQSRRDDLECWLYSIFYLMDNGSLTWKGECDPQKVLAAKEVFMKKEDGNMFKKVPITKSLIDLITGITFEDSPDYGAIQKEVEKIQSQGKYDPNACDWKRKIGVCREMDGDTRRSADNRLTGEADMDIDMDRSNTNKKKRKNRKKLNAGDVIRGEQKNGWKIVNLLGSGGFGDVYKVHREGAGNDKCYALKTESEDGEKRYLRLKVEVTVMMKTADRTRNFEHFIEFVDRGKCEELKCKFVVMGLVGPSLQDIRAKFLCSQFSKTTVFNVAVQTVAAVRDLHSLGYLHRDIKPANYAVGLDEYETRVYMLDFGIAKLYVDADGKHKVPRKKVKFLGTLRYAARNCMKQVEQGRRDDLECWLFMLFELIDESNGMPWRRKADAKSILKMKEGFFSGEYPEMYKKMPKSVATLVTYINDLNYESEPDYEYIIKFLTTCAKDNRINIDKKLDWVGRLKKKSFDTDSDKSDKKEKASGSSESE